MAKLDLTTIGVLVAAIVALVEVIKVGGKLLMNKYGPKNGSETHQANVVKAMADQDKLLHAVLGRFGPLDEMTKDLHTWHKPEISPGVKVWWNRPDLEREIANLAGRVAALDEAIGVLARAVRPLAADLEIVKEEVHDMVLREKYRRGGTGETIPAVGAKKR